MRSVCLLLVVAYLLASVLTEPLHRGRQRSSHYERKSPHDEQVERKAIAGEWYEDVEEEPEGGEETYFMISGISIFDEPLYKKRSLGSPSPLKSIHEGLVERDAAAAARYEDVGEEPENDDDNYFMINGTSIFDEPLHKRRPPRSHGPRRGIHEGLVERQADATPWFEDVDEEPEDGDETYFMISGISIFDEPLYKRRLPGSRRPWKSIDRELVEREAVAAAMYADVGDKHRHEEDDYFLKRSASSFDEPLYKRRSPGSPRPLKSIHEGLVEREAVTAAKKSYIGSSTKHDWVVRPTQDRWSNYYDKKAPAKRE